MASTATQPEMLYYSTQLNKEEQQSLLGLIKAFIGSRKTSERQTMEEYNEELEQAVAEIEAGHLRTHDEL